MRRASRVCRVVLASWIALGVRSAPAEDAPSFTLSFYLSGSSPRPERAGTPYEADMLCYLGTEPTDRPELGAMGWSLGFSAEGVSIQDVTTEGTYAGAKDGWDVGLRDGGFERTELTADGEGACEGRPGAVSIVALSDLGTVTLPVERRKHVLRFVIAGVHPGAGLTTPVRLAFVDGCTPPGGDPVLNRVSYRDGTVAPERVDFELALPGLPPCPQEGAPLQVILQRRNVGRAPEPLAGILPTWDPLEPGELVVPPGRAEIWAGIVSDLDGASGRGVQGWSLSISLTGDATLVDATTAGTVAGLASDGPPGLRGNGFEKTDIVDPDAWFLGSDRPQGPGVVSSVVLSLVTPVTLDPAGTATVLRMTLDGGLGQVGLLGCKYGLRGSGGPVENVATVNGMTEGFSCCQEGRIRFAIPESPFHRGDVNDDGRIDIGDPIRLLENLFLGASRPPCRDAADFNDDGGVDVSDVISPLNYLFLGGPEPPYPGPPSEACGNDPLPHSDAGCAEYASC